MAECPEICNADLAVDVMASFTDVDLTNVDESNCNGVYFLTDDAGLNDINVAASGAWLSTTDRRVRVVASLLEVAAHFSPASETYKAAKQHFDNVGQRGVVPFYSIVFWDRGAETIVQALDAINTCNSCWTHLAMVHYDTTGATLMGSTDAIALAAWAMANEKISYLMSNDPTEDDATSSTNLSGTLNAAGVIDVYVEWSTGTCGKSIDPVTGEVLLFAVGDPVVDHLGDPVIDPLTGVQRISDGTDERTELTYYYSEFLAAGWAANVDLSQTGQGYSLAYKPIGGLGWVGVPVNAYTNAQVTGVTGIYVNGVINPNNNGHANLYLQTSGQRGIFRGLTVGGSYVDHLHLKIHARRQLRAAVAQLFSNSRRVAYDDNRGRQRLATAMGSVLATLQVNGLLTTDNQKWESTGPYVRKGVGWVVRQDSFAAQTVARKSQRLAPALQACIIPAGAVEHLPITLCTLAQPTAI